MSFSVLLSTYSKEQPKYLYRSLESVFNQSISPNEVVLVLDGIIPIELNEVVNEFQIIHPELKIIPLPKNIGLGNALNEGLKHCNNELVARMDSDDICHKNRFEKQLDFMRNNPDIDICGSWIEEFENDISNIKAIKKVPESHWQIAKYIGSRNPMNHPTVMFKKSKVLNAGGYKHFPLFEDWFLWARMFIKGAKFANIQESLLYFRTSPQLYKRRGGWSYTLDSVKFQWMLHNLGIISGSAAIKSSIIRATVYMMPNKIRAFIYSKFLRS